MLSYRVATPHRDYDSIIDRGLIQRVADHVPPSAGRLFVVTTEDVWRLHGAALAAGLKGRDFTPLFFTGGEQNKRISEVEALAQQMVEHGGDRTSIVIAFGGGIVTDLGGFLAATFMRGVPVVQVPTTLLAQVDAAIGGKTGANLVSGKNLIGAFHQPLVVLIDPSVLDTLSDREYRAGLYEIIKGGVIRNPALFDVLDLQRDAVLARDPATVDYIIAAKVRIKAEVVTNDEREGDLRRILNFGHTIGHTLESETQYKRFLHGEAVAFGMNAATRLAVRAVGLPAETAERIIRVVDSYGPIPPTTGIDAGALAARLVNDKKTRQGKVHFVLPVSIGEVRILSGIPEEQILAAIEESLQVAV